MAIRHHNWSPGDILAASEANNMSNNGCVQIDTDAELAFLPDEVNVAFSINDFKLHVRSAAGKDRANWVSL